MKDEAVEEERRHALCAMTRARKRLTLTYVAGTKEEPGFLSGSSQILSDSLSFSNGSYKQTVTHIRTVMHIRP